VTFERTRFAPAPTGRLHLGHLVNAIFVWGLAARFDADVVLRVEDHDRQRSRPEFERQLLDDLDWLGFVPDVFHTSSFRAGVCASRQSDRAALYADVAARLAARGLLYGCTCTRQEIAERTGRSGGAYPGLCRDRGIRLDEAPTWRVRMDTDDVSFVDLLHGTVRQNPTATHGDLAIRDRHGNWTYMFAVVVDDAEQQIDLVVRGNDLLEATGAQIALARLIGRGVPPAFAHHPLILKTPDQKLSKADGDTAIRELAARGASAAELIGRAAHLAGLIDHARQVPAAAVGALLSSLQLASA
jgi:glutamyl/glutaminyl-tRNA synthetase